MDFTKERIIAIVRLAVMLAANIAAGFGLAIDSDSLATIAACAVALVAGIWSWWKNNNVTEGAQLAQDYLDGIKAKGWDR